MAHIKWPVCSASLLSFGFNEGNKYDLINHGNRCINSALPWHQLKIYSQCRAKCRRISMKISPGETANLHFVWLYHVQIVAFHHKIILAAVGVTIFNKNWCAIQITFFKFIDANRLDHVSIQCFCSLWRNFTPLNFTTVQIWNNRESWESSKNKCSW